ncbi:MAG: membrane protein insertion efficiency factor YidD [Alphaproteobacteria bacterium]|nr:membrane protein insertion efficiency factor YidD [Alphaproteobacteria bacterium]MCB9693072.1 membrane protein insertion efficiency factor YidD [Alphaproteobacteria bacterium]
MCATPPEPNSPAALAERDAGLLARVLIAPILFYQRFLSPLFPPACRFEPSCSQYTREAIALWGLRGVWMGMLRILRCQPMFPGGHDPVPLPPGYEPPGDVTTG